MKTLIEQVILTNSQKTLHGLEIDSSRFDKVVEMLTLITFIKVGDTVICIKDDPCDKFYGIPIDKRWHIGDELIITTIDVAPYGVFLHNAEGQNIDIFRVKLKE